MAIDMGVTERKKKEENTDPRAKIKIEYGTDSGTYTYNPSEGTVKISEPEYQDSGYSYDPGVTNPEPSYDEPVSEPTQEVVKPPEPNYDSVETTTDTTTGESWQDEKKTETDNKAEESEPIVYTGGSLGKTSTGTGTTTTANSGTSTTQSISSEQYGTEDWKKKAEADKAANARSGERREATGYYKTSGGGAYSTGFGGITGGGEPAFPAQTVGNTGKTNADLAAGSIAYADKMNNYRTGERADVRIIPNLNQAVGNTGVTNADILAGSVAAAQAYADKNANYRDGTAGNQRFDARLAGKGPGTTGTTTGNTTPSTDNVGRVDEHGLYWSAEDVAYQEARQQELNEIKAANDQADREAYAAMYTQQVAANAELAKKLGKEFTPPADPWAGYVPGQGVKGWQADKAGVKIDGSKPDKVVTTSGERTPIDPSVVGGKSGGTVTTPASSYLGGTVTTTTGSTTKGNSTGTTTTGATTTGGNTTGSTTKTEEELKKEAEANYRSGDAGNQRFDARLAGQGTGTTNTESTKPPSGSTYSTPSYGQDMEYVVKAPYRTEGYTEEELNAYGNKPRSDWKYYSGKVAYEGYYLAPNGKYYPVDQTKYEYWKRNGGSYKGWEEGMRDYWNNFGTFYGYNKRKTNYGGGGGGYRYYGGSGNYYSGSGSSGSSNNSNGLYWNPNTSWSI